MLIDLDNLKLLKVVPTEKQANYWADILLPTGSYYLNDLTLSALRTFSKWELGQLYTRTTNKEIPPRCDTVEMLSGLILNLKDELLDDTDCLSLYAILKREPTLPSVSVMAREKVAKVSATRAPTSKTGERTKNSGQREIIFEAADQKWASLGKPIDLSLIRKMRIELMNELEQLGVKRTTASTTLGAWQKAQDVLG